MNLTKHLIAAGLLATLGFTAAAQTVPVAPVGATSVAPAQYGHGRFDPAKRLEHIAKRQADLKQKLQIVPAQEAAWNSFTTAIRPSFRQIDREAIARLSTPDRVDHLRALRNERMAEMDRRGDATKAFYTTLTLARHLSKTVVLRNKQ